MKLGMAAQIQESMLPGTFPAFPDRPEFDLHASMDPAREVGGDFYDFFLIDDDHLALLIADVSDKGVPAALMMMSAKILIHYRSCQGGTPGQILMDVNNELCEKNEAGMFVTVWMGILDTRDGTLTCVNAGHENPAVKRESGVYRLFQDKHGLPLGVMPGMRYQDYTLQFNPGDAVFVYTDGVPEANNMSGELYGFQACSPRPTSVVPNTSAKCCSIIAQIHLRSPYCGPGTVLSTSHTLIKSSE